MTDEPSPPEPRKTLPTVPDPRVGVPSSAPGSSPQSSGMGSTVAGDIARDLLGDAMPTQKLGSEPPPPVPAKREAPRPLADFGRYHVIEELGRGGMGVVYRAHDKTLGRDVALKVLQVGGRVDDETIERFQREARAAAALDHPNIVRVHDVGKLPTGSPYYTMEMLAGQDLAHAIADGQISPKEAAEAVRQVSLALLYAHQKGILHRDIKPQNIFLRRDPALDPNADASTVQAGTPTPASEVHALLLDFGLAKLAESDLSAHAEGSQGRKSMQSLTRSGEIFGTPAYMPPEQTRDAKAVDARADIYSLGAALYNALAGRPPFDAASLAELLVKVQRVDPPPPSAYNADIDADLDTLTLKCLQKEPQDRYQNAEKLAEDLKHWLAGDPISARPIGLVGRVWRRAKRNKAVAVPFAALSFVLLAGLAMWGGIVLRDHVKVRNSMSKAEGWFRHDHTAQASEAEGWASRDHTAEATELETWFGQNHIAEPLDAIKDAQVLAPDDREVKRLVARIYATQGRVAYVVYRVRREEVRDLEAKEAAAQVSEAGQEKKVPSLEERRNTMDETWGRADVLRDARFKRGGAWSSAVSAFTDALKHVDDEPEAMNALAELYWDEYRSAEVERRPWDARRLEPLVTKYGGKEFEERVRGVREVRVRFRLPSSFAAEEVEAFLFEYRPCDDPPVVVPVPYNLEQERPLRDRVPTLAADRAEWEPVPLDALKSDRVGTPVSLPEAEVKALEDRAAKSIETKHYADAVSALDRLARALPENATHPYNLACCLANDRARQADALTALEEAVRRGWKDAKAAEADEDLKELRGEAGFQILLSVMRGDLPPRHVRIDGIVADSQASKLDLRAGDVLVAIDSKKIDTVEDAKAAIQGVAKEKTYDVAVRRGAAAAKASAVGGGPLGVQLVQADFTPSSPTRFPWTEARVANAANPTAGRVDRVRWGSIYPLERQEANHVRITATSGVAAWSVHLPKGSYLLWIPAGQGLYETRYPFEVARDYEWNEVCELPAEDVIPPMPPAMEAGPGAHAYWTYVPPGPYRASGDSGAQQSPPRPGAVLRVPEGKPLDEVNEPRAEGCWMGRFKVTCGMYLEYLNDREWHKLCNPPCGDWGHVPRKAMDALEQTAYWPRSASGRFSVAQGWEEWPILAISWNDGADYCRWLTAKRGGKEPVPRSSPQGSEGGWRFDLATEDEWERAARGPDGRFFPWGDTFHSTFCRMSESRPEMDPMNPEPSGLFPLDEGPFGARDLAGGMQEMTSTRAGSHKQWQIFKGGTWSGSAASCRAASRDGHDPGLRLRQRRPPARRAQGPAVASLDA